MIPRILHQIWIGPKRIPFDWMETWRQKNPSLNYMLWDSTAIRKFGLQNEDKYNYFVDRANWAGAADVARVEILERLGGVYMDADSICLEPIENEWFMKLDFFAAYEYDRRIANGVIGSVAHHPILQDYIQRMAEAEIIEPPCYTIGGTMLTSCVESFGPDGRVHIFDSHMFYPKWKHRGMYKDKIFARQMWGTTKNLYVQ